MGTVYSVKITDLPPAVDQTKLQANLEKLLASINQSMSTYLNDSEISLINQNKSTQPLSLSSDMLTVLIEAVSVAELSLGAFDITVGPLVNLWGFGPEKRDTAVPNPAEIEQAIQKTGMDKIILNHEDQTLRKLNPETMLDLSAIAKGYAVDRMAALLETHGIADYMVEIGGELRMKGINSKGKPWQIAVEKPVISNREIFRIVAPGDMSIATSGDYRNYFEQNGKRFSHTIDPRTAQPIDHKLASVTVIAPSCMYADALATALMVLGPESGYALAERENIAALFIIRTGSDFSIKTTPEFTPYFVDQ